MNIPVILVVMLSFVMVSAAKAARDTAILTMTGKVLANTCTIDSDSAKQTITLPDISDRDMQSIGRKGSLIDVPFLLKDCGTNATTVKVTASGTADESDAHYFANTIPDDSLDKASGVAVGLWMMDRGYPFTPHGIQSQIVTLTPSSENRFTFYTTYVVTKLPVTPGKVSAVINFTLDYQ